MVVNMGRVGELTDYQDFFQSLPAGVIVGAALFALAIVLLVVSSIFQAIANRCCPRKEEITSPDIEGVVVRSGSRNSFDNPVYRDTNKIRTTVTQEHEISVSSTDGNNSSVNHDYENATDLKKKADSDTDLQYENLKGQTLEPPVASRENSLMYDRPKSANEKTTKHPENDDDELPDYDVPKRFTEDDDEETPDYDVPRHFTN